jgi:hypothetical protein
MNLQQIKVLRTISKIVLLLTGLFLLGYIGYVVYMGVRYKPYKVRVTNVTDSAFTVSWITDSPMTGIVYYGEKDTFLPGPLAWVGKKKAVDDRDSSDAMSECVSKFNKKAVKTKDANFTVDASGFNCNDVKVWKYGKYYTHHITVQNLDAEKEYFFRVGDGVISYGKSYGGTFAEREMPAISEFKSKTLPVITKVEAPNPAYGTSYNMYIDKFGMMAKKENFDSIIFLRSFDVNVDNYPLLSSVSNSDGGWSIDLANIRDAQNQPVSIEGLTLEFIPQVDNAIPLNIDRSLVYKEDIFPLSLLGNREEDWEVEEDADENTALSWLHSKLTSKTNAASKQSNNKSLGRNVGKSANTNSNSQNQTGNSTNTGTTNTQPNNTSNSTTGCIPSTLKEPFAASGCDEHATCHWRYRIGGTGYVCGYTSPDPKVQHCRPPECMNVYSRPGDRDLEKVADGDQWIMVPKKRFTYDTDKRECIELPNYQSGVCTSGHLTCLTKEQCEEYRDIKLPAANSQIEVMSEECQKGFEVISVFIGNRLERVCVFSKEAEYFENGCKNDEESKSTLLYYEPGSSTRRIGVLSCPSEDTVYCYHKKNNICSRETIKGTLCDKSKGYYSDFCDCVPEDDRCTKEYYITPGKKCETVPSVVSTAAKSAVERYLGSMRFSSPFECENFLRDTYHHDTRCGEYQEAVSTKKNQNENQIVCLRSDTANEFKKHCSSFLEKLPLYVQNYRVYDEEGDVGTTSSGYLNCPKKEYIIPVEVSGELSHKDINNLKCCPYASETSPVAGYNFSTSCEASSTSKCNLSLKVVYCLGDKDEEVTPVVSLSTSSPRDVCENSTPIKKGKTSVNGKYCCHNDATNKYSLDNCPSEFIEDWEKCLAEESLLKEMEYYNIEVPSSESSTSVFNKALFKSLADDSTYEEDNTQEEETTNQVLYYPGEGMYEVTIAGGRKISLIGEDDISYFFYKDNDGVPGYQAPQDPNNPKESEDMILPKSVVLFSSQTAITTKYSLKRGINIISFGFMPSKGGNEPKLNSVEFLELVNMGENKVSAISYFEAGKWSGGTTYDFNTKETKGTVFDLVFGRGYVVIAEQDTTISIPGLKLDKSVPVAFSRGWNLVGIHGYSTAYTARTLIESINTIEGLKSDNVTWWPTSRGMYQGYQLINGQSYGQDYPISPLNGYFVRISEFNPKDPSCKTLWWNPGGNYNGQCDK